MAIKGRRKTSVAINPAILAFMERTGQTHKLLQKAPAPLTGASSSPVSAVEAPKPAKKVPKGKKMTLPEREMMAMLSAQKVKGEILHYGFEEHTLAIGDPMCRFTPDFTVVLPGMTLRYIECKGPYLREDAIVKFKCARKQYPWYDWRMWQRTEEGEWQEIYQKTNP